MDIHPLARRARSGATWVARAQVASVLSLGMVCLLSGCGQDPEYTEGEERENSRLQATGLTIECTIQDQPECGGGELWNYVAELTHVDGPEDVAWASLSIRDGYSYNELTSIELELLATGSPDWGYKTCQFGEFVDCSECNELVFEVNSADESGLYTAKKSFSGEDVCSVKAATVRPAP